VALVSTSPERDDTILVRDPFAVAMSGASSAFMPTTL
jgi:hypothetical protein